MKLKNVVEIYSDLSYPEWYRTMHESDLLIPDFRDSYYYNWAASSSVAAAVIAQVPLLATRYHLASYTYLDDRGCIVRPDNVDPISAIAALRANGTALPRLPASRSQASSSSTGLNDDLGLRDSAFSMHIPNGGLFSMREAILARNVATMEAAIRNDLPDFSYAYADIFDMHGSGVDRSFVSCRADFSSMEYRKPTGHDQEDSYYDL